MLFRSWLEQQGPGLGMTRLGQPSRDVHRRAMHDTADSVAAWQPVGLMFSSSPTTPAGRLTVLLMPSNDALSVTTRPPASGDPLICPPARPVLRKKCRSRLTERRRGRTSASDSTTWLQGSTRLVPCPTRAAGTAMSQQLPLPPPFARFPRRINGNPPCRSRPNALIASNRA